MSDENLKRAADELIREIREGRVLTDKQSHVLANRVLELETGILQSLDQANRRARLTLRELVDAHA